MRIDSSGRVGIGTSSPSAKLEVSGPSVSGYGQFVIKSDTVPQMTWYKDTTLEGNAYVDGTKMVLGSITSTPLVLRTVGTERMRIDSSGRVGIGATAVDQKLHLEDSSTGPVFLKTENTAGALLVGNNSSGNSFVSAQTTGKPLIFETQNTERMRIDSSGNLLVGRTDTNVNTAGALIGASGYNYFTRDGGYAALFNRLTSDGDIVEFRKGGTTVGSIGAKDGDLYIGTGDTQLRFNDGGDDIRPASTDGAGRDAAVDLGSSSIRFKDLYLSGGVYLGGTGSANKLDDYEEGTWTITSENAGVSNPSTVRGKLYTKIGRLVTVSIEFVVPSNSVASQAIFGGLPFASSNLNTYRDVGSAEGHSSATFSYILSNTSNFYIYGADFTAVTYQALSNQTIVINLTYMTS
jgi:hypothetical protein